jgi:multicomponent Na+:H+ antiporter subunit C
MTLEQFLGLYNYWIVIFLMMTGFYIVIRSGNLIKTIIGLNIFQTSVFLLYITMGKVAGGQAPILRDLHGHDDHSAAEPVATAGAAHGGPAEHAAEVVYSNPLPSVLMLTAIVVGIATTALALALIVRIREDYGSIEEADILELDREAS